jgi:hypothetical protein
VITPSSWFARRGALVLIVLALVCEVIFSGWWSHPIGVPGTATAAVDGLSTLIVEPVSSGGGPIDGTSLGAAHSEVRV